MEVLVPIQEWQGAGCFQLSFPHRKAKPVRSIGSNRKCDHRQVILCLQENISSYGEYHLDGKALHLFLVKEETDFTPNCLR